MRIGVLELHLDLPGVGSLKEKRRIVKRVLQRIRNQHKVAAAEVAYQDLWQSSGLGFTSVGNDPSLLQRRMGKIVDDIESGGYGVVVDFRVEVL